MSRFARFGKIRIASRAGGKNFATRVMIRDLIVKLQADPRSESFIARSVDELARSALIDFESGRVIRFAEERHYGIAIIHNGIAEGEIPGTWEAEAIATELIPYGMLYHFPHVHAYREFIHRAEDTER